MSLSGKNARLHRLKAKIAKIEDPAWEEKRRQERQDRRDRSKALVRTDGQRDPAKGDSTYKAWIREWSCVECVRDGRPSGYPVEAAHQKHATKKGPALGSTGHDATCVPLCAYHHRIAPNCCDPAQSKYWDRLQIDVAAYVAAFRAAYRSGLPGEPVVKAFAQSRSPQGFAQSDGDSRG